MYKYKGESPEDIYLRELIEPLEKFQGWDIERDEHEEVAAKAALKQFFTEFKKATPHEHIEFKHAGGWGYYSYFLSVVPIWEALMKGKYCMACHELITVYAYEQLLQKRVYNALMYLERKFLE